MATKIEGLERVVMRLPINVKEWYRQESESLGMTMSQYMSYLLVTYKRNQEAAEAIKNLSALTTDQEVKDQNKEIIEMMKSDEVKEMLKEISKETAVNRRERRHLGQVQA